MTRLDIKKVTYRALFAKSGNQCAFPECTHELIDEDNVFIAQVCHIAAANKGGERYDQKMTDEDRRSFDNLIVLCYRHHKKTDNVQHFPAAKLVKMKQQHEDSCSTTPFEAPKETIRSIMKEQRDFTRLIFDINEEWLEEKEVNLKVSFESDPQRHVNEIEKNLKYISNLLSKIDDFFNYFPAVPQEFLSDLEGYIKNFGGGHTYENAPLSNVLWEARILGGGNSLEHIRLNLLSLSLHANTARLLANPSDEKAHMRVADIRVKLRNFANTAVGLD